MNGYCLAAKTWRIVTMANRRPGNGPNSKSSSYRLPLFVGLAAVIMLVLGFLIPGWGWLAWLGFVLILVAAFLIRVKFVGDWIPTLFAAKERDNEDNLPPPPTIEGRS